MPFWRPCAHRPSFFLCERASPRLTSRSSLSERDDDTSAQQINDTLRAQTRRRRRKPHVPPHQPGFRPTRIWHSLNGCHCPKEACSPPFLSNPFPSNHQPNDTHTFTARRAARRSIRSGPAHPALFHAGVGRRRRLRASIWPGLPGGIHGHRTTGSLRKQETLPLTMRRGDAAASNGGWGGGGGEARPR